MNSIYYAELKATQWLKGGDERQRCIFCGKKYWMWHYAVRHLYEKHPMAFAQMLPESCSVRHELIRSCLKLVRTA